MSHSKPRDALILSSSTRWGWRTYDRRGNTGITGHMPALAGGQEDEEDGCHNHLSTFLEHRWKIWSQFSFVLPREQRDSLPPSVYLRKNVYQKNKSAGFLQRCASSRGPARYSLECQEQACFDQSLGNRALDDIIVHDWLSHPRSHKKKNPYSVL